MSESRQEWRWIMPVAVGLAAVAAGFAGTAAVVPSREPRPSDTNASPYPAAGRSSGSGALGQASVWAGRTPAEQIVLAGRWGDVRDAQSIRERLDNLHTLPNHFAQTAARATLLLNWIAVEPEAACQWCSKNRREDFGATVQAWAADDPEAATAYAWALADQSLASSAFGSISSQLADSDPDAAIALIASLPTKLRAASGGTIKKLAEADPHALFDVADHLGIGLRNSFRSAAAKALASTDPAAALAWWANHLDHPERVFDVFGELPSSMWPDAIDIYLARAGDDEVQWQRLAGFLGRSWVFKDPSATLDLFAERTDMPERQAKHLTTMAMDFLTFEDPEAAVAWFLRQENPDSRLAERIASRWGASDLEAARAGLAKITEPAAKAAVEKAFASIAENDTSADDRPTTAAELVAQAADMGWVPPNWIQNLPPAEQEQIVASVATLPAELADTLAQRLLNDFLHSRPIDAAELMLLVTPRDEEQSLALAKHSAQIAAFWGNSAPSEAASWATRLAEGPLRTTAATNLVTQWKAYDPAAARNWAQALPDQESRAAALAALGE